MQHPLPSKKKMGTPAEFFQDVGEANRCESRCKLKMHCEQGCNTPATVSHDTFTTYAGILSRK
jgi:hypothetical protein